MSILTEDNQEPEIVKRIWNAIYGDAWIYAISWGQPRTGKTTCDMGLAYNVYKDWDQVLNCFVFQLNGLLHKMDTGKPCRIWDQKMMHHRVPFLIGDDWGANGNKAKTQHEKAWDLVKGAWDTYGTKLACFFANMNLPDEITLQLCNKYTDEIYIEERGVAKYDHIEWEQNYTGWAPRHNKDWRQTFHFPEIPEDVYREYDEMRMALVDELNVLVHDAIAETEVEKILKRSTPKDMELLETLNLRGPVSRDFLDKPDNAELKEAAKKAKARGLVLSERRGTNYWFDITDLGMDVLDAVTKLGADPNDLKRELRRTEARIERPTTLAKAKS
jgi:hypothetical protein